MSTAQESDQTVAASPSVPVSAMPTASAIQHLADTVGSDSHSSPLTQSAHIHLQAAAHAMSTGSQLDVLHLLRAAQTDVADEHRVREAAVVQSSASAFGGYGPSVPPAEQSSAHTSMIGHLASAHRTRVLGDQIAHHIDSIRRAHFHGMYGSTSSPLR